VETARALVAHGADVVGVARDLAKQDGDRGCNAAPRTAAVLSSPSSISLRLQRFAPTSDDLIADVLASLAYRSAGVMATPFDKTADGFEDPVRDQPSWPFRAGPSASLRFMKPGSRLVACLPPDRRSGIDLDDRTSTQAYDPRIAYGRSKIANILFAVEFDQRHRISGVRATAVIRRHPPSFPAGGERPQATRRARQSGGAHRRQPTSSSDDPAGRGDIDLGVQSRRPMTSAAAIARTASGGDRAGPGHPRGVRAIDPGGPGAVGEERRDGRRVPGRRDRRPTSVAIFAHRLRARSRAYFFAQP
jgi:NAD(P)-dependent dehydrogenase (short-subunit alcohol dehydrogenase family)